MKTSIKIILTVVFFSFISLGYAQRTFQYDRASGQDGLNVFETSKTTDVEYDGMKVWVGGDFALQYQGLSHESDWADGLVTLGKNINLPTANFSIDAQLAEGVRVHLKTYLSSRHHNEAWVKGGYLQIDKLNFIKEGFLEGLMDIVTIRVGMDDINYGDAHFRRSDNAMAIYNPFVGNYIMDAFTTEPYIELYAKPGDLIFMAAISNGYLHPTTEFGNANLDDSNDPAYVDNPITFYAKAGWDSQMSDDLRLRLTGSFYSAPGYSNGNHLYAGDRTGARYYGVMDYLVDDGSGNISTSSSFRSGRFNPGFRNETAFQINPFVKFQGLEFFGVFEQSMGTTAEDQEKGSYTQLGAEVLYRIGSMEQLYIGGRFNSVSGHGSYATGGTQPEDISINRINIGAGWFMTKNTLLKLEYVTNSYSGDGFIGSPYENGKFNGLNIEAAISF